MGKPCFKQVAHFLCHLFLSTAESVLLMSSGQECDHVSQTADFIRWTTLQTSHMYNSVVARLE